MPDQPMQEADRQRQEINMFAAMALGGAAVDESDDSLTQVSKKSADSNGERTEDKKGSRRADPALKGGSMEMFAAAAQMPNSGTFKLSSADNNKNQLAEKSNLDAAVAALSENKDAPSASTTLGPLNMSLLEQGSSPKQLESEVIPMFAEEVVMPRPLFFGPILPPRVIREARRMLKEAMEEVGPDEHGRPPRLSQLPGGVRNVVGMIRTYGYGLDVFEEEDEDVVEAGPDWRGNPHVSTFQPVWGEAARLERTKERRKRRRPENVARASTAPARLEEEQDYEASLATAAGQPSGEVGKASSNDVVSPDKMLTNEQFGMWLRGDDDASSLPGSLPGAASVESFDSTRSMEDIPASIKKKEPPASEDPVETVPPKALTEQEMFSQWARGNDSFRGSITNPSENVFSAATFQKIPQTVVESDEDSVIDDELKKQVGVNDHLSKAIASLEGLGDGQPPADLTAEESKVLLSQVDQNASRERPLSNYELTNGCIPLFGVDDSPLPVEGDLGIHETKEEQQRSIELKRSQEIIEKFVGPNVFGPIACPNPALNPDDCHSWNARAAGSHRLVGISGTGTGNTPMDFYVPSFSKRHPSRPSSDSASGASSVGGDRPSARSKVVARKKQYTSRSRYGWWSVKDASAEGGSAKVDGGEQNAETNDTHSDPPLQLPPKQHSSSILQVVTLLEPSPEKLCKDNLPLSLSHAATSMAQSLPYLSDRPPSYRYLQIDTQAVGFPTIGGEIEPLFCSLAIYNVETISSGTGGGQSSAPIPDLQRCGRVTEVLNFDVLKDQNISERCSGVLWPYANTSLEQDQLQSTRCGVFPLPSNLAVANLYAVMVVRKVLSEDNDFDPYLKPGKSTVDVEKLRAHAERASNRCGNYLMPFAFGVAPLLQVFGTDNPVVPSSRAVQIPLFRYKPGLGERQIIEHIMIMLFPRADHRPNGIGGPAAVTNGGTAMLVMRNFGYLGLHAVVDDKSSLARDRLVDFAGELQLRRRGDEDLKTTAEARAVTSSEDMALVLPDWYPRYVSEPCVHGGRNLIGSKSTGTNSSPNRSPLYAQEIAPVPLQLTPAARAPPTEKSGISRGRLHGEDVEPFYHTSFCNELLCHPRLLHNCPRGNIVIRVGLRELEWKQEINAYFAHVPRCGPSVHNPRRGPFLVQNAFTSCSPRGSDPHFIDEFKVKLPLDLKPETSKDSGRIMALFFSVFSVRISSKSKWTKRTMELFGGSATVEASSAGDSDELDTGGKSRLEHIHCGFLPITNPSLIDDGLHDVRVVYTALSPSKDMCDRGIIDAGSLILVERTDGMDAGSSADGRDDLGGDDASMSNDSASERNRGDSSGASLSDLASIAEDSQSQIGAKSKLIQEPMSLSVRIVVHSSVHSQNETLSEFLSQEPDLPILSNLMNKVFMSTLRYGPDFISSNAKIRAERRLQFTEQKLLESVVDITRPQLCALSRVSLHILRIMPILWRLLVCGNGEPDLIWANPCSPIPLRTQTFATIMHLFGAATMHMSKHGVTQVDGTTKWNVVAFGRVLALLFDERKLFGPQGNEVFDELQWEPKKETKSESPAAAPANRPPTRHRRRHVRNNYDLFNDMPPREGFATTGGPSQGPARPALIARSASAPTTALQTFVSPPAPSEPAPSESLLDVDIVQADASSSRSRELKVDSKSDFQSALRAASSDVDFDRIDRPTQTDGAVVAKNMVAAFSGIAGGHGRWMTAPTRALSTICESDDLEESEDVPGAASEDLPSQSPGFEKDTLDDEIVTDLSKSKPTRKKTMRIPKLTKSTTVPAASTLPDMKDLFASDKSKSLPRSDEEIESAGIAFLDVIGESLGHKTNTAQDTTGEAQRVGSSYHRKNRSRSSIDWTLLPDQHKTHAASSQFMPDESNISPEDVSTEHDESMSTLRKEEGSSILLPNFVDRLVILGKESNHTGRWFPFVYEVIIMQWAAILIEQRTALDKTGADIPGGHPFRSGSGIPEIENSLAQAAARSIGVAIASAPLLFEVIKNSLGYRVSALSAKLLSRKNGNVHPPLVTLDKTLLQSLEQIISMVTDACLDSRNFDSWDLRQTSVDVNDCIIRFLRDMFSFLSPSCVHRLILVYLSRFVTKDGKQWQDRDSSIGLRCSWEITKLRLNAVTALIRFPDFVRINAPQLLNWSNWWTPGPRDTAREFFDGILDRYQKLRLSEFVGDDSTTQRLDATLPPMRPHWLAEIAVDVCLLGTEHAEHYIQNRSSSLLFELFWACSQESVLKATSAPISAMFLTFLEKLLSHVSYLSNFAPKSQLRKDVLPCVVFVLQSAPTNLLRALWGRLCLRIVGKGFDESYGNATSSVFGESSADEMESQQRLPKPTEAKEEADVFDMFRLLNLTLGTLEYEGCDEHFEADSPGDGKESIELWRKEFLLARRRDTPDPRSRQQTCSDPINSDEENPGFTSSISREWHAHDGSIVVINTGHQIVLEMFNLLLMVPEGKSLLNPAVLKNRKPNPRVDPIGNETISKQLKQMKHTDVVVFVRAATSLYLHSLALRESDIVVTRTFKVSAEIIKIFGIKIFLEAVGETLQHWMRVISLHCGARRAHVRIEATDLLELILRSTWECYGSFFRIRVPLLAVQTEVMERIVATAATRFYRDQRRLGTDFENFSNVNAEASLVPLWRTLDRVEKQPASQNIAFRGALIRIAGKLKKLYRAYVAARVLSFIQGARSNDEDDSRDGKAGDQETALARANRICVLRVINASEGHSKQFLGFHGTSLQNSSRVAHYEAVEDALMDAADVFSPTELPEHRVAWLRMLADFHASRKKYAEEATCHFHIHVTLQQAARLHGSLWSNTPFLPWTDGMIDPVYIDGDTPTGDPDYASDLEIDESDGQYGRQMESANSFRRIFYRVANSVGIANGDWETDASKCLFYGVTFPFEFHTVSPWISLREMEAHVLEEAEAAGDLFLKAGIVESSRFALNLATNYYAEKFNYAKLAIAYGNLARTVVSQVPPIDAGLPQEVSATLGRFYRVWFHGGAPDELSGVEFIYRTEGTVRLEDFGDELREVITSIIPNKTPIHLVLDGRTTSERSDDTGPNYGFSRIGPAPLEPVKIKVTPLRPLFGTDTSIRGLPEWFFRYVDESFAGQQRPAELEVARRTVGRSGSNGTRNNGDTPEPRHRDHARSYSASFFFSSSGSSTGGNGRTTGRKSNLLTVGDNDRGPRFNTPGEGELCGVDKFCFVHPKDRARGNKDWWKTTGDFAEKSLKVTQLQVAQSFPACVARQAVVDRLVYSQTPLEAGVDAVCQWCAVLFRTAVATTGMAVLGTNHEPGIGQDAAKVVADCIHSSHVKEIGLSLLKKNSDLIEGDNSAEFGFDYDRLTEDEVKKLQLKLARLVVVFIELLHLLIARNRDILLDVIQERKKGDGNTSVSSRTAYSRANSAGPGPPATAQEDHKLTSSRHYRAHFGSEPPRPPEAGRRHQRVGTDGSRSMDERSRHQHPRTMSDDQSYHSTLSNSGLRTDSAIAVQSELQRGFIVLTRALYPRVNSVMQGNTPRWLKQCAQDNYFSLGTYRQTVIPIAEELCFSVPDNLQTPSSHGIQEFSQHGGGASDHGFERGLDSPRGSERGSTHSVVSRGSERYGFGHF